MVNYAFVLLPLYIYPETPTTWQPLYNAANNHPNVTFQVVVNPNSGPGAGACPNGNDTNYINAIATLNSIPNIKTLGYIHTATSSTCGSSGKDICVCSQPQSALQANISTYQNWPTAGCTANNAKDIHVDGIFYDESPSNSTCLDYMRQITSYAKQTLTRGSTSLFNAGVQLQENGYWDVADYINIFENNEAALRTVNVTQLTGDGNYASQATLIVYGYTSGSDQLLDDVRDILSVKNGDGVTGLSISDLNTYAAFGTNLEQFVADVDVVGQENK
ncbi:hypothetical protein PRZ48_001763 [Zasmidium cellare]|uniref:Spherulin 4 n=1 Tax=Zasmidium cellare TaxID=395010 RepID=A0ABR0F2U3_ZASCE|nr:hypothetical protein PRZ48_001763 [Zasmidium cellare]